MANGVNAYKKTSLATASKEKILLLLYQAAIKNCRLAIDAMEEKNIAKKGEHIGKLQDIILELNSCLDHSVGGQLSQELSSLYDYMLYSSTQANIKIDPVPLKSCLSILNTLYDGWVEAVNKLSRDQKDKLNHE